MSDTTPMITYNYVICLECIKLACMYLTKITNQQQCFHIFYAVLSNIGHGGYRWLIFENCRHNFENDGRMPEFGSPPWSAIHHQLHWLCIDERKSGLYYYPQDTHGLKSKFIIRMQCKTVFTLTIFIEMLMLEIHFLSSVVVAV